MTTDDLRTRAREAAAILYADPVKDSAAVYTRHALRYYQRGAYEAGFLAHAAQQPSREELARVMREAGLYRRQADAIHALLDGPVS